jgi:hypothetical protein
VPPSATIGTTVAPESTGAASFDGRLVEGGSAADGGGASTFHASNAFSSIAWPSGDFWNTPTPIRFDPRPCARGDSASTASAELADRAAAPEFQEWPTEPQVFEFTEEQEKLFQDLNQFLESAQRKENDTDED